MDSILSSRREAGRLRRAPGGAACEPSVGPHSPGADLPAELVAKAILIRQTERRLLKLFAEGLLAGTVHTCLGQEWIGVAVAAALRPGDQLFSNHRCHGHYLAWTDDVEGLVAELAGRATGVCGGRGGSQHLCKDGFYSNGIQGGIVPVATGLAMAAKLRTTGGIAAVFIGDGTFGEGAVYEAMNIASLWSLPLLMVVEDNGIAQSTPRDPAMAGGIPERAAAFAIECRAASTAEPAGLLRAAAQAANDVRHEGRPILLHVATARLHAHSKGDDTRSPEELAVLAAADPLNRLIGTEPAWTAPMIATAEERLDRAVELAVASPLAGLHGGGEEGGQDARPPAGGDRRQETGDGRNTEHRIQDTESYAPAGLSRRDCTTWFPAAFEPCRVVDGLREGLAAAMAADERVLLLGEDIIDPYGGAFKVTAGLSTRFGSRVRGTPISEAGIVGLATGLAMAGFKPLVEIMFGDFVGLAFDQFINHAAKFAWMYNGQVSVPLIVRTPMGGYRGYGPTHSQCLDKHLLGVPGTRVLALHSRLDPRGFYPRLLAGNDRPCLVIENKLLYGRTASASAPSGWRVEHGQGDFPWVRLAPNCPAHVTVVAWSGMVEVAEAAMRELAEQEELSCELLVPSQLFPLDARPVLESVGRTGRLVTIEEGQAFAGLGGELIARVCEAAEGQPPRCRRVAAAACPVPASKNAEHQALPDAQRLVQTVCGLLS